MKVKQKYKISDEAEVEGIDKEQINDEIRRIREKCGLESH